MMGRALFNGCLLLLLPVASVQAAPLLQFDCNAATSRLELRMQEDEAKALSHGAVREAIDVGTLVGYGPVPPDNAVRRSAGEGVTRQCGQLTVRIRGGFFNPDPEGELGAADDYPVIELSAYGNAVAGPIAIGNCSPRIARYSYMVACPDNWATALTVFESGGDFTVYLRHVYDEYRKH